MTNILKGKDKILNLKEINIMEIGSQSISTCPGKVNFIIDCETEKGKVLIGYKKIGKKEWEKLRQKQLEIEAR